MIDVVRAVEAWRPRGVGSPESFIVRVPEEHLQHEFERRAGYQFSAGFPAPRIVEVPADVYPDGDVVEVAKEALKGVTDGPWRWVFRDGLDGLGDELQSETSRTVYEGNMTWGGERDYPTRVVSGFPNDDGTITIHMFRENAEFIAATRTLVPALVAEVERLRAELADASRKQ